MAIKIKKLTETAIIPKYKQPGDAGFDLHADISFAIYPGCTELVPTGLSFEMPLGYEMQIRSRSGLALTDGVTVLNSPGTIDSGYRGEVQIMLYNTSESTARYQRGDRIAQGVICPVVMAEFEEVDELSITERGAGGFGHTGK